MALLKPENQPFAICEVHNKQKKLSESNLEIVCGVRPMMNDTPSTGKSTLCCNISITPPHPHTPHTTKQKQNKTKTTNKQTNKTTYLFAYNGKQFWDCSCMVCVKLRITLLVPEKQTYVIIFWLHKQPKISVCMENCSTRKGRALARDVHGDPGGWSLAGVARG